MQNYLDLTKKILTEGIDYGDRTKTGRRSIYGHSMKFDLADGFPLVTVKHTFFKGVAHELLWFLRGETNIKYLVDNGVHIWDEWATSKGELGPVYGKMWRDWPDFHYDYDRDAFFQSPGIDQIKELIENINKDPHSSRHVVSGWNPSLLPDPTMRASLNVQLGKQALPPCHTLWQVFVDGRGTMHMTLYQRSADVFLGVPFNIASYSLLLMMIAKLTGYKAGTFTWSGGDCHLYHNHIEQAELMLTRQPGELPSITLNYPDETALWDVQFEDILLEGYEPQAAIKGEVAI